MLLVTVNILKVAFEELLNMLYVVIILAMEL